MKSKTLSPTARHLICLLGITGCLLLGCAPLQPSNAPLTPSVYGPAASGADQLPQRLEALRQQLEDWKGVPYRLGGLSREGVDCSGFVYLTYLSRFDIRLPRSTYQQSRAGDYVFRKDLQAGDLIFFRLGYATRHVGIYLEDNHFMHASKSVGVTRSRLDAPYWSQRYWKAVRINKP